jgi:hypothetical protein
MTPAKPERDKPAEPPKEDDSREKGVMGNQHPDASRTRFLRELKRAARGLLDKRSPQD